MFEWIFDMARESSQAAGRVALVTPVSGLPTLSPVWLLLCASAASNASEHRKEMASASFFSLRGNSGIAEKIFPRCAICGNIGWIVGSAPQHLRLASEHGREIRPAQP
ncbi:hypothetical protein [Aromatoleum evansii]|uniref:hypothetical protein n=1 Tax=Aromatoleum evansii TaxID=59406 RepID=UPI00145F5440|nr:hypothetical protein [Aromatoleum evansii]NMG28805.1 hypothetical protein [Aromatoleum evansii]